VPSPFPGMNPYLERESYWHYFHQTFIPMARGQLARSVGPRYFVKVEEYVFVHELAADRRHLVGRPDVLVGERPSGGPAASRSAAAPAPAYDYLPAVAIDQETHSYLSIRDREGEQIVTVIELLSPSNKNYGADRNDYLRKRRDFFAAGIHVVEIDLLRGGPRLPFSDVPQCDYLIAVSRAEERPRVGIWPVDLRERLPAIPISLRAPDPDVELDVQKVVDEVYDSAAYGAMLYLHDPEPPLSDEDAQWARQFVPASA